MQRVSVLVSLCEQRVLVFVLIVCGECCVMVCAEGVGIGEMSCGGCWSWCDGVWRVLVKV